ncbi:hypothetical protein [Halodesulfovibrio sp.]|jgi:hypothetical protein|uniref:hypothetical protein n=1 Tax=Halodesulfovibrio sp. TaxID=1912772 RepID=UPI0025F88C64|nr:hypothetical protein [Halodesulfovibrio sp.]MCT4534654.1 hypothetical protein [Halodesulfovibrio sp.]
MLHWSIVASLWELLQEVERMLIQNESDYNCFCPVAVHVGDVINEGILIHVSESCSTILLAAASVCADEETYGITFSEGQQVVLDITPFGAKDVVMIDAVIKQVLTSDGTFTLNVTMRHTGDYTKLFADFMDSF